MLTVLFPFHIIFPVHKYWPINKQHLGKLGLVSAPSPTNVWPEIMKINKKKRIKQYQTNEE